MRAHEIAIDEADTRSKYAKEINQQFKQAGYRKIGSGVDAAIWAKDAGSVVKVLMPDDERSLGVESYRTFYDYCIANSDNPFLPKFGEVKTINVLGREYDQYTMERLKPLRLNSMDEIMTWWLASAVVILPNKDAQTWESTKAQITDPNVWGRYHDFAKNSNKIVQKIKAWTPKQENKYHLLFDTMRELYLLGRRHNYGWDLHTENVMQRGDGQPVIVDPWSNF